MGSDSTVTRRDVLARIKEQEGKGEFDVHVDPIDYDLALPVDENFHYIKKGFKEKFMNFIYHSFVVKPFTRYVNKKLLCSTIYGKENIKGVKSAIVTCNHVNKFDCLVVKKGVSGHRLFIVAAPFNNQKGKFGDYMRAGGMMPLSENHEAMRNFNDALAKRLKNNNYVLFFPEQAMWWNYEKPRPYKNGAFHYAVKYDVPVIPTFITYIEREEKDEEGIPLRDFYLHIMKPIYPKNDLDRKANIEYLKETNFEMCKTKYEEFYKRKLTYNEEEEK